MSSLIQLTASGAALGALYALVAIAFTLVLKTTGSFNMFPGALVLLGAYVTYQMHVGYGLPFFAGALVAALICGLVGVLAQKYLFAAVSGKGHQAIAHMSVLLVSLGLISIMQAFVISTWGALPMLIHDPWGLQTYRIGGIAVAQRDLWVLVLGALVLGVLLFLMQRTRIGIAMRATAADPEAAAAQGINPRRVAMVTWLLAGAVSVLAGVMLATELGGGLRPNLDEIAFMALPALILGGLTSLQGCIYGGLALGLVQTYASGYAPEALGQGFSAAVPWVFLILILMLKPTGLARTTATRSA